MNANYNTRVRQAISERIVGCSKEKSILLKELESISARLANEEDKLTYKEYMKLKNSRECLCHKISELNIVIDTWDAAREICLNVADEM